MSDGCNHITQLIVDLENESCDYAKNEKNRLFGIIEMINQCALVAEKIFEYIFEKAHAKQIDITTLSNRKICDINETTKKSLCTYIACEWSLHIYGKTDYTYECKGWCCFCHNDGEYICTLKNIYMCVSNIQDSLDNAEYSIEWSLLEKDALVSYHFDSDIPEDLDCTVKINTNYLKKKFINQERTLKKIESICLYP